VAVFARIAVMLGEDPRHPLAIPQAWPATGARNFKATCAGNLPSRTSF
jgi:hypothetical protein